MLGDFELSSFFYGPQEKSTSFPESWAGQFAFLCCLPFKFSMYEKQQFSWACVPKEMITQDDLGLVRPLTVRN